MYACICMYICMPVCMYVCILPFCRGFRGLISGFETFVFFTVIGRQPLAQPPTWRTRISLLVRIIPFDLSGLGDPTSSYATAGIALRVILPRKPHHYVKVETLSGGNFCYFLNFIKIIGRSVFCVYQLSISQKFQMALRWFLSIFSVRIIIQKYFMPA
jgi:hypothetical protein